MDILSECSYTFHDRNVNFVRDWGDVSTISLRHLRDLLDTKETEETSPRLPETSRRRPGKLVVTLSGDVSAIRDVSDVALASPW